MRLKNPIGKIVVVALLAIVAVGGAAAIGLYAYPKVQIIARTVMAISAEQSKQSADLASIKSEVTKLQTSVAKLETEGRPSPVAQEQPSPAADPLVNAGPRLREWAFLDDVDVYQKAGLIEIYGGVLTQRRTGPVAVRSAILTTTAPKTWLVWSPDYSPLIDAQRIELDLDAETIQAGKLTVGVILADNSFVGWTARLGPDMPADPSLKPVAVPNDIAEPVGRAAASVEALLAVGDGRYVGDVPATLKAALGGAAPARRAVKAWVLAVEGGAPGAIAVRRLALSGPKQSAVAPATSALAGQVQGVPITPGDRIELVLENNEVRSNELALDGSFGFADVPTRLAASLRYRFKGETHYASLGRWFRPLAGTMVMNVFVKPEYDNPGGKEPNPAETDIKSEFDSDGHGGLTIFRYAAHRRTTWPGSAGYPREFVGRSFANNFGFLDRDRAYDNRDRCLRIGAVGGSTYVALQVKPFEKFTTVLEAELGRRLGRCVEVISAGRDNGDLAANYRVIRDYIMKFQPDVVVIEHMVGLATQMDPRILKSTLGWSYEHNVVDNFYFDASGALTFRSWDPSWALDAVAPTNEQLIRNLGTADSFTIPYADFPPEAKASFDLFAAIAQKLRSDYPKTRFVMATGHDQAGCRRRNDCDGTFEMPDGRIVRKGVAQAMENFAKLCVQAGIDCVQPPVPEIPSAADETITYAYDAHYSIRGHQWLARNLADQLFAILSKPRPEPRK